MFRGLKLPVLYAVEALLLPLAAAGFFATTSFVAAKPIASLSLQGKALPIGWEAAVPNHGGYYQWYAMANHPALSAFSVLLLALAVLALHHVRKAQALQAGNSHHLLARVLVVLPAALTAYWFIFHIAAPVAPA